MLKKTGIVASSGLQNEVIISHKISTFTDVTVISIYYILDSNVVSVNSLKYHRLQ